MKLYTEEQVREVLSNMLLTTEQVESILKELSPLESPNSPFKDHRYWSRLKEKEVRKFKLDDSFKKALEEAVISDTPASSWMDDYRESYDKLLKSGMFFEFHPTWTGEWDKDKYAFCYNKGWEKNK